MKKIDFSYAKKVAIGSLLVMIVVATACFMHFEKKSLEFRTKAITSQLQIIAKSVAILKHYNLEDSINPGSQFSDLEAILKEKKLLRQSPAYVYGSGDYRIVWDKETILFLVVDNIDLAVCDSMVDQKSGIFINDVVDINDAFNKLEDSTSVFCFGKPGSLMLAKKV